MIYRIIMRVLRAFTYRAGYRALRAHARLTIAERNARK
jgi:hypothetical protein